MTKIDRILKDIDYRISEIKKCIENSDYEDTRHIILSLDQDIKNLDNEISDYI